MVMPFMEQNLSFLLGQEDRKVVVRQVDGGYSLQVRIAEGVAELHTQRGGVRVFRTLDSISSLLGSRDVSAFTVRLKTKKNKGSEPSLHVGKAPRQRSLAEP